MGLSQASPRHVATLIPAGSDGIDRLVWRCAGCGQVHAPHVKGAGSAPLAARWEWNGSLETPTLAPSLLLHAHGGGQVRCHSFVRDGAVQFLHDCGHALAGKTVAMLPEDADPWAYDDEEAPDGPNAR